MGPIVMRRFLNLCNLRNLWIIISRGEFNRG
jgi:hypothetical protein